MVMRWSIVSLPPGWATVCQMSATACSRKARAARTLTSAWAAWDCTTALSRIGLFMPRGTLLRATSTKVSSAARATPRATPEKPTS